MFEWIRIFGRHAVDGWRDEQTLDAAAILNDLAAELACMFEEEIKAASWRDALISPRAFVVREVAPAVRAASDAVVLKMIERANRDLRAIVEHQAVWSSIPREVDAKDHSTAAIRDLALAVGPIAGSVATAAAIPAFAVTTTTAWFGLVTTTVISWPAVLVGTTAVGALFATGILNVSKIRANGEDRLRKNVHDHVVATLLKGERDQPSILEQLTALFAETAREAKRL